MSTQIDRVISQMRDLILSGELRAGERIVELQFTERLNVSRTPLRLALAELEREGILERLPSRGFRVRGFSLEEILDAVEVRGTLEAMAVRLLIERHWSEARVRALEAIVEDGRRLIDAGLGAQAPDGRDGCTSIDAHAWAEVNRRFHEAIAEGAGSRALSNAMDKNNATPFVGPGSVILPPERSAVETALVVRAQADHEDICTAIKRREAARASALVLEHTYRSKENKRRLIAQMQHANDDAAGKAIFPPIMESLSL
ncbi:GntR family transcriptional regulator [Pandoraea morbifera]|uniref:GntR family transcriptional regulator n=1 Tax=Pandoraea morbifera TaxID=2508300 RepID=A0A5E4VUD2_9BURK|nr:GntR family transcriptional regulator [Pandoraea morbifera]VVE16117.1 GntR family transcriptional regulator [Pandoraea morbifera]